MKVSAAHAAPWSAQQKDSARNSVVETLKKAYEGVEIGMSNVEQGDIALGTLGIQDGGCQGLHVRFHHMPRSLHRDLGLETELPDCSTRVFLEIVDN